MRFLLFLIVAIWTGCLLGQAQARELRNDFIGVLDIEARYGGQEAWIKAVWGETDDEQSYIVSSLEYPQSDLEDTVRETLSIAAFDTVEIDYEIPAIMVFRKRGDWVQVRRNDGYAWLKLETGDRFVPYIELFDERRVEFLRTNTFQIADYPGGPTRTVTIEPHMQRGDLERPVPFKPGVHVTGRAFLRDFEAPHDPILRDRYGNGRHGQAWLRIRVKDVQHCAGLEGRDDVQILVEGWVPAFEPDGDIAAWFSARGC